MFALLFPLLLSPVLTNLPTIVERVYISDSLHVEALYLPEGSVLPQEGMLLSVEDFGILQGEVESSTGACNTRLNALTEQHKENSESARKRCSERNKNYKNNLVLALEENKRLESQLEREKEEHKLQMWINLGIVVGGSIATIAVLKN